MTAVWLNPTFVDEERRRRLYAGEVVVYSHVPAVESFAAFIREMVEATFAPHNPRRVHEVLTPEELAPLLGKLKPVFTHHPEARRLVMSILESLGADLNDCHLDVPKLRSGYPTWHLNKGIAYAFGPHRDTWYGAPQAQINWWLPAYPLESVNAMAFYPRCFSQPVRNDSKDFNYYRRNAERRDVTQFIREDPRVQPSARDLDSNEPELRLLPEVGGIILFSGAQLHATVSSDNCLARYSVDFRTVSRRDIESGLGAANVDGRCIGTALRDFRRCSDWTSMPEELSRLLDPVGPAEGEVAVFKPER